jgi:hypothetical protein
VKTGLRACLWLCALLGGFLPVAQALDLLPRSVSRSRQFVIYAKESALRGAVGTVGEETKSGLLSALGLKDEWRIPIVIDLRYPEPGLPGARPSRQLMLAQTGVGLKIELHLMLGEAGHGNRIRDEIVRTVLLELAYRDYQSLPAGQDFNLPPAWLVEGFSAYLENQENGMSARLFAALLPTSQTMSLQEFLGKNPATMDSTSRSVYRAYAFTLVRLLLQELADGKAGLAAYIRDIPGAGMDSDKSAGALRSHFAELAASPDSLDKWWSLSLARLAASDEYQPYSVEESEKHLAAALAVVGSSNTELGQAPRVYALSDYKEFLPLKNVKQLLEPARRSLLELSARVNPLYQPIVYGYQEVIAILIKGKPNGIPEKLSLLETMREEARARKTAIDDYMNWYEATQMKTISGAFEEYLRAAKQLEASQQGRQRPDAISVYLDGLEMEFR